MTPRKSEDVAPELAPAPRLDKPAASAFPPAIDIPESYDEVERLIIAGSPAIFVSGSAGTGKTTLIRHLGNVLPHRTVVVAPTGVAALNAGGVTIHSFFQFPPRIQDPSEIRLLADRKLIRKLELLVVDEVSMLRCDVLDCIDAFLRANRDVEEPFGGVQMLFVGDLYQLPPVVPRHEWEVLRSRGYASPYFFSAHALQEVPLAHVELDRVYRQRDPAFVALLNTIREAEDIGAVVGEINDSCCDAGDGDHDITLTCTNRRADEINSTSMAALDSAEYLFEGEIEGVFRLDKQKLPSPIDLRLKVGARVMFTRNDEERRWVNGTTGIVREVDARSIRVEVGGRRSSKVYDVLPVAWESYEYVFDEAEQQIVARKTGEYRQYPLMLAWAVTIHKSQGKTLDRILVDFGSGAFASGQAYVALSRVRSLDGIRLARPLRVTDVKCDPIIRRFYQALYEAGD
ncbi:MAG: ATP-dependent DNA helicase [Thermoleophilia bacterium]